MTRITESIPPIKRRKLNEESLGSKASSTKGFSTQEGIDRPISPPVASRNPVVSTISTPTWSFNNVSKAALPDSNVVVKEQHKQVTTSPKEGVAERTYVPSPVQLTKVAGLSKQQNVDTVDLKDILGDPMIKECWNFNYLFNLDFVMKHLDEDVRDMVKVKIIHGFWKRDDGNRIALLEQAEKFPNIELLSAYIPDPFGTHHTKMMILFRHDDTAQVIIHTANMIERDWRNMTQAVWRSPLLPLSSSRAHLASISNQSSTGSHAIGSGERFKVDLLRYIAAYEKKLKSLRDQLQQYDFSSIRAAFLGSVPSRQKPSAATTSQTSFGWLGLQEILSRIPVKSVGTQDSAPEIVIQISSIATLGPAPTWLSHFQKALAQCNDSSPSAPSAPSTSASNSSRPTKPRSPLQSSIKPNYKLIFPTPEEIRTSLDGYMSGGSIHWKLQSAQQQKQLAYMRPLLHHWKHSTNKHATSTPSASTTVPQQHQQAHRGPAAPHIKTYIRFSDAQHKSIDWALVTSANLSKQAWGDVVNKKDEIWIQSWEAGVLVWPELFADEEKGEGAVSMVPVFGRDMPGPAERSGASGDEESSGGDESDAHIASCTLVGFRMPYDLPLSPYTEDEMPWCATSKYDEPDWMRRLWGEH